MQLIYSLDYICDLLVKYLANHPLFVSPPVTHIATSKQIKINYYRQNFGIPTECGLVCSIYPAFTESMSPTAISCSLLAPDSQRNYVHFIIHFYWSEPAYDSCGETSNLRVPSSADICSEGNSLIYSSEKRQLKYYQNPGFKIISQYLELTRLIFEDREYQLQYGEYFTDFQMLNINYLTSKWDESTNIYWHQGRFYLRLTTLMTKEWQQLCDRNLPPLFSLDNADLLIDTNCKQTSF